MKIFVNLSVSDKNPESIYKIFQPEISKKDRSGFSIVKEKDCIRFEVEAEDSIALRATLNSITKLLTVYEKVKGVV